MSRRHYSERDTRSCTNCGTSVYWTEPYCMTCVEYVPRTCGSCNRASQTLGDTCLFCDARLGPPVFGIDRQPDPKRRWDTRSPESLSDAAYLRWIKGAKGDATITLATCDGCGEPFGYSTDKRPLVGSTSGGYAMSAAYERDRALRDHGLRTYRKPVHEVDPEWQAADPRFTYGGKAHEKCVDHGGNLIVRANAERNVA